VARGVKGWQRHGWASREGEERKERGVGLGLPAGSKDSGGLHESQTLEGEMKKLAKVHRILGKFQCSDSNPTV
jgi:hypothetical protein